MFFFFSSLLTFFFFLFQVQPSTRQAYRYCKEKAIKIGCKEKQAAGFRRRFHDFMNELLYCIMIFWTAVSLEGLKKTQVGTVIISPAKCLLGKSFYQALLMTNRESKLYE